MRKKYGVSPKKKILIISPDTLPLKYHEDKVAALSKEDRELFINKVTRTVSLGERAFYMASVLADHFDVTVAVPTYNYFFEDCINRSELFFDIVTYDWEAANRDYSKQLEDVMEPFEVIILQASVVGFHNCMELTKDKFLIVDGWVPLGVESATAIGTGSWKAEDKEMLWKDFKATYYKLLARADIILFSNLSQKYYYLGLLNTLDEINWKNYQHSKLLRIPVSVNRFEPIPIDYKKGDQFNLLWFGSAYGWYNPFILIDAFTDFLKEENITLTFIGCNRFKRFHNSELNKKLENTSDQIVFIDEHKSLTSLTGYHLGVVLAYNYLEKQLAQRYRSLQLASVGIPVCTNKQDNVGMILSSYNLCYPVLTINPKQLAEAILQIRDTYQPPPSSTIRNFQNSLTHERTFAPLVGYLKGERKWRLI